MLTWLAALAVAQVPIVDVATDEVEFSTDVVAEMTAAQLALDEGRAAEAGRRLTALADASGDPSLWYRASIAWFEAGALPAAEAAVARGLELAPDHVSLLLVRGGVRTDQGRADDARKDLERAMTLAADDPQVTAAARYNLGLLALEAGDFAAARTAFEAAQAAATRAADERLGAAVAAQQGRLAGMDAPSTAGDPLSAVSDALGRGDLGAARTALGPAGTDRRSQIRRWIGEAAILRAEGRYDAALSLLVKASGTAREGGLVREAAQASSELGVVYAAAGAYDLARSPFESAVSAVAGTNYRLLEAASRAQAGVVAVRLGDLATARAHLERGKAALGAAPDVATRARLDELAGAIAGRSGDRAGAEAAYGRASAGWTRLGAWADAARVATSEVELYAGDDEARLVAARQRAEAAFGRSRDPLGPGWIALAEAVGRSRANDADGTMNALAEAVSVARAVGGPQGERFAAIAEENARKLLSGVARDPQARARAASLGFESIVSEYTAYGEASTAFESGRKAYDTRAFANAVALFDRAEQGFSALGEARLATDARRNAGWARYNAALSEAPGVAWQTWTAAADLGRAVGDLELEVRSRVAAAIVAEAAGRPKPAQELAAAARLAEEAGWLALAGQAHARRAELEPDLPARVAAAEMAWSMTGGSEEGLYAIYVVAVKAYEAEEYALAVRLAERIDDARWKLAPAVIEVRDAARAMMRQ